MTLESLTIDSRIRAGSHAENDVSNFDRFVNRATAANPDDILNAVFSDQFLGVYRDREELHGTSGLIKNGKWTISRV